MELYMYAVNKLDKKKTYGRLSWNITTDHATQAYYTHTRTRTHAHKLGVCYKFIVLFILE